jgi:glycerol-3-phosphate cytidylyltransferase-like family protein
MPHPQEVAFHLFGKVRSLYDYLQSSSTRFDAAVKALLLHLQRCVVKLYVQEWNVKDPGGEALWIAGKNWQYDYEDLMVFVTRTLNTAYTEYERGRSGGLTFEMYNEFGELLQNCREWMKQTETVVLATQEEYTRRKIRAPVNPVIRQDGAARSDQGSDEVRQLQKQVSDLQFAMRANEPAIRGFHDNKRAYDKDAAYFKKTLMSVIGRMEKAEELAPVVEQIQKTLETLVEAAKSKDDHDKIERLAENKDDHDKIEALLGRVAALEKPWYRRGATKTSVHPEADLNTLLCRMEAFNS